MVSIRTVVPDLMRSTGGTRAEIYPQTTVSGVEPKVTSGLLPAGAGCAAAGDARAKVQTTAHQNIGHLDACLDIDLSLSSDISTEHNIKISQAECLHLDFLTVSGAVDLKGAAHK